jgi:uncharacterized protein (DUF342 family)
MMNGLNGYFQFSNKNDGLYLTVYPPKIGGKKASMDDFMFYIEKRKIFDCNIVRAKEAFSALEEPITVKVSDTTVFPSSEFGDYNILFDTMSVEAKFYPPFEGANELSKEEIIRDLLSIGIKYGIVSAAIDQFIAQREYCKTYILAKGLLPRQGTDGRFDYHFNIDLKPKPKLQEDGTVDFHSLNNVNHVKTGDIIATMIPEDAGEQGFDVLGRVIQPRKVKKVVFRHEKNTIISEDGLQLISQVNGHVTLDNDRIFVSNVLELINVDNSTGDIQYDGNIIIQGNVLTGFTVRATGDIAINGIIEGAYIYAGGNITLSRGIQGIGKAIIESGGNIVTKFIESAESVTAAGDIESDTILHSRVTAKGQIFVKGRNGLIIGGDVKACSLIEANTIGNEIGTSTTIGVGVDPSVKKRIDELKNELDKLGNKKIQLAQLLTALRKKQEANNGTLDPEKQNMLQNTMKNWIMLEQQISVDKKELEDCRMLLTENAGAKVKVNKTVYPGVKLVFGEQYLFIREKYDYCQFMKVEADIKSIPF